MSKPTPTPTLPATSASAASAASLETTLLRRFGIGAFRPHQEAIVRATLAGRDVLLVARTSFGKSLCLQLPSVHRGRASVIITPLVVLMQDQVKKARERGLRAFILGSRANAQSQSEKERQIQRNAFATGELDLIYVSPEALESDGVTDALDALVARSRIGLFALDEAHCLMLHDGFRPAFRALVEVRAHFASVPWICCTATCSPSLLQRLRSQLLFDKADLVHLGINHPGMLYRCARRQMFAVKGGEDVTRCMGAIWRQLVFFQGGQRFACPPLNPHPVAVLGAGLEMGRASKAPAPTPTPTGGTLCVSAASRAWVEHPGTHAFPATLVYVTTRKDAENVCSSLRMRRLLGNSCGVGAPPPWRVDYYHAKRSIEERNRVYQRFLEGSLDVVVATIAFGMGVDKPDVRYVIHAGLPSSLENLHQEAGRAGRDGHACESIVLWHPSDGKQRIVWAAREHRLGKGGQFACSSSVPDPTEDLQGAIQRIQRVTRYCDNPTGECRRAILFRAFASTPYESREAFRRGAECCDACAAAAPAPAPAPLATH